jgi:hypothetical protein
LVIQIQDGINVVTNTERLLELLTSFVLKITRNDISDFCRRGDAKDAAQQFICQHILKYAQNQSRKTYIDKFDRNYGVPFCAYLRRQLIFYCSNWENDKVDAKRRGPSLNGDRDIENGNKIDRYEFAASSDQYDQLQSQQDMAEYAKLVAPYFLRFFNAVNMIDKDKTSGKPFVDSERVVNEQKLLAFHIAFINKDLNAFPKFAPYTIQSLRNSTYSRVNRKNDTELTQIFGVSLEYMKILEERIVSRSLTNMVFLSPEKNLHNTAYAWLRSSRLVKPTTTEHNKLIADERRLGSDYFYGIK